MSQQQIATYTPDASYPAGKTTLVRLALLAVAFTTLTAFQSQAQTFHKLHDFTGGADGSVPLAGLIADRAGNLYGTASTGGGSPFCGDNGCGTAFRMKRSGTGWIFAPLYQFQGGPGDGADPGALAIAPDGLLYGTTTGGGIQNCGSRCGTVFQLSPPVTFCRSVLCLWKETLLYRFQGTPDAGNPTGGPVVLDQTGSLYGTSMNSGCCDFGAAWELSRSGGGWSDALIYNGFHVGPAISGLVADSAGNLYGTYHLVGYDTGVYQLSRSGSGWHFTQILDLDNLTDGGDSPLGGLFVDNAGNVYGTTADGGTGGGGTVFQLSAGTWNATVLYSFTDTGQPNAALAMDSSGNLYGTTFYGGPFGRGNVYKLSPSTDGWIYTDLYDFTGGSDGSEPVSNVLIDAQGNLYGTTSAGGTGRDCFQGAQFGCGVVWELTP